MKRKSIFQMLYPTLLLLLVFFVSTAQTQEKGDSSRSKAVFVEFLGSGASIATANFDMRFNKGQSDGLGFRVGIGGGSISNDNFITEGSTKTEMFTIPLEVNYIYGEARFSFEFGYALTYASISEDYNSEFLGMSSESHESENIIVSYLPIGLRWKPDTRGFTMKVNLGPLWNFSAPNLFSDEKVVIWGGLALGYAFY